MLWIVHKYLDPLQTLLCASFDSSRKYAHPLWKLGIENYHSKQPEINVLEEFPYLLTYKDLGLGLWNRDSTLHLLQSLKCVGLHSLRNFNYVVCNRHPEIKKNVVLA